MLVFFCLTQPVFAEDNMDSRTRMKVNRAKRHQSIDDKAANAVMSFPTPSQPKKNAAADPCAGVEIGNVYTDRNRGATPRENTVVVTGDVINVPSNKCRR